MEHAPRLTRSQEAYNKLRRSHPELKPAKYGLALCDALVVLGDEAFAQRQRDLADLAAQRRMPLPDIAID